MTRSIGMLTLAVTATALAGASSAAAEPVCVAIVLPSVQGVEGNASDLGLALRELFTSYLTGPSIQPVSLDARLPSQAFEEARQKQCGFVLTATLTLARRGGGMLGKALGQAAGAAAWHIPTGSSVGSAAARGAAAGGAQAAAAIAAGTKARDEMRLEYALSSLDDTAKAPRKEDKAKARVDGEDLLTPLVERAATAIATAISGK
jgi:hypothetical protein